MNALRTELRRTIALWLAVLMAAVGLVFFFSFTGPWRRDSSAWGLDAPATAQWTRYLLLLVWPMVVGAGAIQGMRDSRSGVSELFASTSRPAGHRALTLGLTTGIGAVVGYLVLLAVGFVQVAVNGGMFTLASLMPVVLGLLAVLAGVAIGLGVGRLLPHPVTAPALAVLALVAVMFLEVSSGHGGDADGLLPNWVALLSAAQEQPRSAFLVPSAAVDTGQFLWFAGLIGTGLLLLVMRSARARLLAVLPVVAGLVGAAVVLPASAADNLTPDKAASELVCDGSVCVEKLHEDWLPTLAGPAKEALRLLEKLPQHPVRVEESTEGNNTTVTPRRDPELVLVKKDDTYTILPGTQQAGYLTGHDLTMALLKGAGTPPCEGLSYSHPEEEAARRVMAYWLAGSATPPPLHEHEYKQVPGLMQSAWTALHAQPEPEQLARVAAARQLQLSCQGDPLTALLGGAH